jgi:hypothetical protein
VVLAGCVLGAIAAPIAIVAIMSGGGGGDGGGKRDVPAVINLPGATSVQLPPTETRPPAQPTSTPRPTKAAIRTDCDEIRGTAYRSDEEREWFVDNCDVTSVDPPDSSEPTQPPNQPPPSQPPAQPTEPPPPTEPPSLTASDAISIAASSLASSGQYNVSPGACSAASFGGNWIVTCNATLAGCPGSNPACRETLSTCVTPEGAIRPTSSC